MRWLRSKQRSHYMITIFFLAICPILMISAVTLLFIGKERQVVKTYYNLDEKQSETSFVLYDKVLLLNSLTKNEFNELVEIAEKDSGKLSDVDFLQGMNSRLKEKYSFILVKTKEKIFYLGKRDVPFDVENQVSVRDDTFEQGKAEYIQRDGQAFLMKRICFNAEGETGNLYIITDLNVSLPHIRNMFLGISIVSLLIIMIISVAIVRFTYYHIIRPIQNLKIAVNCISMGDLDYPIAEESSNGFAELYSDFRKMQLRLKQLVEEQEQNSEQTREVIGNISHDLKTPLTAIKGYAEGILDGVASAPEQREKYIRTIYTKAVDMSLLVDELSFFTNINRKVIPYNFSVVQVNQYFSDCISELSLDLEMKNINLLFYTQVPEETYIQIDVEKLKRVMNNIIGNAGKYIHHNNGIILVKIMKGDGILVAVEDNGIGISKEELPYIFERFYRTDSSRNSKTGGSGLGLAIAKKIVEDHKGEIWAESIKGKGTKIMLKLKEFNRSSYNGMNG